jgi:energy-coupling factor transporter transmembrane protein EcfT
MEKDSSKIAWIILGILVLISIILFIFIPLIISLLILFFLFLPAIIYILWYKLTSKWILSIFLTLLSMFLILIITIGLFALDLKNFSDDVMEKPKFVLLKENNELIFGFKIEGKSQPDLNSTQTLNKEDLNSIQEEINKKVKDKIILVIDENFFKSVEKLKVPGVNLVLTKQQAFDLLKSDDPGSHIINILGFDQTTKLIVSQINKDFPNDKIKLLVFALVLTESVQEKDASFLLQEFKNKNLEIYPKRFSINLLIKVIPEDLVKDAFTIPKIDLNGEQFSQPLSQPQSDLSQAS